MIVVVIVVTAVVIVLGCGAGVRVGRHEFDKLTRQRDGIPFIPFDDCHISRSSGRIVATVYLPRDQCPLPNQTIFMHVNGIMTPMMVNDVQTTYGAELVECNLQDFRSRVKETTIK